MHEVGLLEAALRQAFAAAREAGAHRIEQMTFGITPDGHVTEDAVQTLLSVMTIGTAAEHARVAFEYHTYTDADDLVLLSIDVDDTHRECDACAAASQPA